jgi:putative hydrolase of the HAD superfamily
MTEYGLNRRPDIHQVIRRGLKAIVFDVDGTLYELGRVRRSVICRFVKTYVAQPARGLLAARAILAYRKALETMRAMPADWCNLAEAQLELACAQSGAGPEFMRPTVARWVEQEPLRLLALCLRDGVLDLLHEARKRGIRLGVYSDYPAQEKLRALGLEKAFDVVVTAQDPMVRRLKPDPLGLEVVLKRLGVSKQEALYIGDRPEIDGLLASRAHVRCLIVGRRRSSPMVQGTANLGSYWELIVALRSEYQ